MANLYKNETITSSRVNVFLGWENFNPKGNVAPGRMDQNLCGRLWRDHDRTAIDLSVTSCTKPVTNATRAKLAAMSFKPASVGQSFGPTFATHLFRLSITIPAAMAGSNTVHLLWDSNSEAMVMDEDGTPLQGLVGGDHWARRADFALSAALSNGNSSSSSSSSSSGVDGGDSHSDDQKQQQQQQQQLKEDQNIVLYVEMSCNGLFGAGRGGDIEPPDMDRTYTLAECCLAVFDQGAWALIHDVTLLQGLAKHLDQKNPRRVRALQVANDVINAVDVSDPSTYPLGRTVASDGFLSATNGQAQSQVSAMLHSHIDLAWLWPMAATPGKGARTFASALRLLDAYPDSVFVQSQAQLYAWVRDGYPSLWTAIRERVREGRFIPVGGTWVEMDCNLPSGEALVRQFVHGQMFFQQEFGHRCREFWLPDTFGYASQLPQIMRGCGVDFFLTQKLSWNVFNKFPHSSFVWEGLDGSTVLAHMPPAETYNSQAFPEEVLKSARDNRDVAVFDDSVLLVGHGDGGGGASPAMLESLARMRDLDGMPKTEFDTPVKFFQRLQAVQHKLPRWVGELYFELHRGTYTSQAHVKKCNRDCELMLGQVEVCSSLAALMATVHNKKKKKNNEGDDEQPFVYPVDKLDQCWKRVLCNQFHDTLPGSCIGMVYDETKIDYDFVLDFCREARTRALHLMAAPAAGTSDVASNDGSGVASAAKKLKAENGHAVATAPTTENGDAAPTQQTNSDCPLVCLTTGPLCSASAVAGGAGASGDVRVVDVPHTLVSDLLKDKRVTRQSVPSDPFTRDITDGDDNDSETYVLVAVKGLRRGYGMSPVKGLVSTTTTTTTTTTTDGPIDDDKDNGNVSDDDMLTPVQMHTEDTKNGTRYTLGNGLVTVTVEPTGRVSSLKLHDGSSGSQNSGREALLKDGFGGNHLVVYDDVPMFWCAWDTEVYAYEKYTPVGNATNVHVLSHGPLECSIFIRYPSFSSSSKIEQIVRVRAGSSRVDFDTHVDWQASRKCLRVLFDTDVRASHACYDSQFGHVQRTTRFNTSWDVAKFESVAHRWCDLSEHGFGVTLMSDCKYGFSVRDGVMRLSLLRASKSPDDRADMGTHRFMYAFMPHWDAFPKAGATVLSEAHDLNETPVLTRMGAGVGGGDRDWMFELVSGEEGKGGEGGGQKMMMMRRGDLQCVGVSCFKQAERWSVDRDKVKEEEWWYVVRVFEALGGRGAARLKVPGGLKIKEARACNMLEEDVDGKRVTVSGCGQYVAVDLKPFEVRTVRMKFEV